MKNRENLIGFAERVYIVCGLENQGRTTVNPRLSEAALINFTEILVRRSFITSASLSIRKRTNTNI